MKGTNSRYGAEAPFLDDCHEVLYFSEFDSNGYHLASLDFRKLLWEDVDFLQRHDDSVLQTLVAQHAAAHPEPAVADSSYLDPERYPSRHYSRLLNGFHIHSWAPVYYNVDRIMSMSMDNWWDLAAPGATLYSQNALGDVTAMLGWSWWQGCHSGHGKVAATVVDFDVEFAADIHHLKQTLALLVSGSFVPDEQSGIVNNSTILYSNASEIVSSQINNIFHQLDIPVDLGLNYQPGAAQGTNDIFDVAISTQLFNNRVTINGNIGNQQYMSSSTSEVVGNVDVEIKLNRSGPSIVIPA